jgi:hypothetical protein
MYSSYSFTVVYGGEWSAPPPGRALPHGKDPLDPLDRRLGEPPELVWTQRLEEKPFSSAGNRNAIARSSSP